MGALLLYAFFGAPHIFIEVSSSFLLIPQSCVRTARKGPSTVRRGWISKKPQERVTTACERKLVTNNHFQGP